MKPVAPSNVFPLLGTFEDSPWVLGRDGRLWAVLAMEGRDPDGLSDDDILATSAVARNALGALPPQASVQQWYFHTECAAPTVATPTHPISRHIETARAGHLNTKTLYRARLFTAVGIHTEALASKITFSDFVTTLMMATVDGDARLRLRRWINRDAQLVFLTEALRRSCGQLRDAVDTFAQRWSLFSDSRVLDAAGAWRLARALAELDPALLDSDEQPPEGHWYGAMLHGRAIPVQVDGAELLKLENVAPRYARLASVVRLAESVNPGFWATSRPPLLNVAGDFLFAINAGGLSPFATAMRFKGARDRVRRAQFSAVKALTQGQESEQDRQRGQRYIEQHKELDSAEALDERWHDVQIAVAALGTNPERIRETALALDTALTQAKAQPVWETPGLLGAYRGLQFGAAPYKQRSLTLNTSQVAAAGVHYKHSAGTLRVDLIEREEPLIILETVDGQPYGFTPFAGEKATVIGCGPSRSGKTFAKNVLAAHWPRWGGHVVAIDYDPGSECLAHLFGEDAALFRNGNGMNPFAAAGVDTPAFKAHFSRLVAAIMDGNDDPSLRTLERGEQDVIDDALDHILRVPEELQTLSNWATHLPPDTLAKVRRWLRSEQGRYDEFLDNQSDRIGRIERLVTVFNLAAIRDDQAALAPVMAELLWRVTRAFERPGSNAIRKKLVVDEAHLSFAFPELAKYLVTKARTWAKWGASVELWNHQASEYAELPDWDALRTSASCFLFTSAPDADIDAYCNTFKITPQDVAVIRQLVPKRDLYLIQPETGVRKQLILSPDPDALIWASSSPQLAARRDELITRVGLVDALTELRQTA